MKKFKAIALKKRQEKFKVVGKGRGYIAKTILEIAKEHDIPIQQDPELVDALCEVELYENVPEELYVYIVKVLEFLYNKKDEPNVEGE